MDLKVGTHGDKCTETNPRVEWLDTVNKYPTQWRGFTIGVDGSVHKQCPAIFHKTTSRYVDITIDSTYDERNNPYNYIGTEYYIMMEGFKW